MVDPEDADKTPCPLGIQSFTGEKENKAVVQLCKEHCRKAVTRTVGIRSAGCCPEQESGREASHRVTSNTGLCKSQGTRILSCLTSNSVWNTRSQWADRSDMWEEVKETISWIQTPSGNSCQTKHWIMELACPYKPTSQKISISLYFHLYEHPEVPFPAFCSLKFIQSENTATLSIGRYRSYICAD